MTPRAVVSTAKESMTMTEFFDSKKTMPFSRIPLYGNNMNEFTGYFLKDDLLLKLVEGHGDEPLSSISRSLTTTTNTMPIGKLFNQLTDANEHFALVLDLHGTMTGVISTEDIIETLLGLEIVDEHDHVEDLQAFAREKFGKAIS